MVFNFQLLQDGDLLDRLSFNDFNENLRKDYVWFSNEEMADMDRLRRWIWIETGAWRCI